MMLSKALGFLKSGLNWTVQLSESGRSLVEVNGYRSKWTNIRLKMDSPNESKDKRGRSKDVKVDGPKTSKWTA